MELPRDPVEGITAWFVSLFPGTKASAKSDQKRDVIIFRVVREDGVVAAEIEMSFEALTDHPAESIIHDLIQQRVVERLQHSPHTRLSYSTDRQVRPA